MKIYYRRKHLVLLMCVCTRTNRIREERKGGLAGVSVRNKKVYLFTLFVYYTQYKRNVMYHALPIPPPPCQ